MWICSYLVSSNILSADRSQRYSRRSVIDAIRYPSDFRCIRVLNSAFVSCSRCALGFLFAEKYAHQNDPLNQGNLQELKLRLKIVRYPGIEVDIISFMRLTSACNKSFVTNMKASLLEKSYFISSVSRFFIPNLFFRCLFCLFVILLVFVTLFTLFKLQLRTRFVGYDSFQTR